jgi:hypothetical protein
VNERDEARKVLDELRGIDSHKDAYSERHRDFEGEEVAALLRYARRAKAEALMEAAEVAAEAEVARCKDGEDDGVATRSNCVVAIFDLAAKLEGGTDGL